MTKGLTFDEINALVITQRSIPYDEYFGEMRLSNEEKQKRIKLAERLENAFRDSLIFLLTMYQYNRLDWDEFGDRLEKGYRDAISGYIDIDEFITVYIAETVIDIAESTRAHIDDPYYFSADRAMFAAENESNATMNYQQFKNAVKAGKRRKRWNSIIDNETRKTHRKIDGKTIKIDALFSVGDSLMRFPKDTLYNPEGKEIVNCRCSITYI